MDMNEYFFKRIYTIAFRLTGKENASCELATCAIVKTVKELDLNKQESSYVFKHTALEVCKMFIEESETYINNMNTTTTIHTFTKPNEVQVLQEALLNLKPLNRITVIWKDILEFQLDEILPIVNINKKELSAELSYGRRQLKGYLFKNDSADLFSCIQ
jgi:DNA-directed RNA polymerase specialized sigma24 family protein